MDPAKDTIQCTYDPKTPLEKQTSPHSQMPFCPIPPRVHQDVLSCIGLTPMIKLNKIPKSMGVDCEILVKCDYMNPGGSYKDRAAYRMVLDAEKQGKIKPGDTIIEASSGNMGLGLALAAAVKGYKCIITLPEKMSNEKVDTLKALGATVVRTPTECAFDDYDSHINTARRIQEATPNSIILNQYNNPSNPLAHYDNTAEEIFYQTEGNLHGVVLGAGTGGGITGISRKLKQKKPDVKIIGVDPIGSILAMPQSLNVDGPGYKMEGIGYDFVPRVLDRSLVDQWYKCEDKTTMDMARRLITEEGILCGGSSGAAVHHALEYAKEHKLGKDQRYFFNGRLVVVLVDGLRNYMTKHLSHDWMVENLLYPISEYNDEKCQFNSMKLEDLQLQNLQTYEESMTIGDAIELFKNQQNQIIAIKKDEKVLAVLTQCRLLKAIMEKGLKKNDLVKSAWTKEFVLFDQQITVTQLSKLLQRNEQVYIQYLLDNKLQKVQLATPRDLLKLVTLQ